MSFILSAHFTGTNWDTKPILSIYRIALLVPVPMSISLMSRKVISIYVGGGMKSESGLISFIQNYPHPASFKEADTGKYIIVNHCLAQETGLSNTEDLIGLTVHDLQFAKSGEGLQQAKRIAELDYLASEKKSLASDRFAFFESGNGEVQFDEVTKVPVLGHGGNILGVVTYQSNLTPTLPLNQVYDLYRRFYDASEAIARMLNYLGIEQYFSIHPTEAPLRIFLAKAERYSNKQIGRLLGISHRTVDYQFDALRNRVIDGDLRHVLTAIKRRDA